MNDNHLLDFYPVPGSAVEAIIDGLGIEFMRKLASALGGLEIRCPQPQSLHDEHRLVVSLGREDAARLCDLCQGEVVFIPKGHPRNGAIKNAEYLVGAARDGIPVIDIAVHLGTSVRQVRRWLGKLGLSARVRTAYRKKLGLVIWRQREEVVAQYCSGSIKREDAARRLSCHVDEIAGWARIYRSKGTIIPKRASVPPANAAPAASNGGLTGRHEISGTLPPAASPQSSPAPFKSPTATYPRNLCQL